MARKGVLLTDPSVRAMTWAQWLAEFYAIRAREDLEASIRRDEQHRMLLDLCEAMIRVLGLDTMHPSYRPPPPAPPAPPADPDAPVVEAGRTLTPFMPASWLWTHPRMIEALQKQRGAGAVEADPEFAEFDAFSRKLQAVAENRAEPESLGAFADFFKPEVWERKPNSVWDRELAQRVLRTVKPSDSPLLQDPPPDPALGPLGAPSAAPRADVSLAHAKMADSRIESDRKAAGLITDARAAVVSQELDKFQQALLATYGAPGDGDG